MHNCDSSLFSRGYITNSFWFSGRERFRATWWHVDCNMVRCWVYLSTSYNYLNIHQYPINSSKVNNRQTVESHLELILLIYNLRWLDEEWWGVVRGEKDSKLYRKHTVLKKLNEKLGTFSSSHLGYGQANPHWWLICLRVDTYVCDWNKSFMKQ